MNKDELKNIIFKKAKGNSNISFNSLFDSLEYITNILSKEEITV